MLLDVLKTDLEVSNTNRQWTTVTSAWELCLAMLIRGKRGNGVQKHQQPNQTNLQAAGDARLCQENLTSTEEGSKETNKNVVAFKLVIFFGGTSENLYVVCCFLQCLEDRLSNLICHVMFRMIEWMPCSFLPLQTSLRTVDCLQLLLKVKCHGKYPFAARGDRCTPWHHRV